MRTNLIVTIGLLAIAACHPPAPSKPSAPQAEPDAPAGDPHDFDFELGTWTMHLKRLVHPLSGSTTWIELDGSSITRPIWNGVANLGEIDLAGAGAHIQGLSLRLFDPEAHRWNISFANAKTGELGAPPMVGGFQAGRGVFYDHETLDGRPIRARFVFSAITATAFHFEQAFSTDEGATWEVNWIADFKRT